MHPIIANIIAFCITMFNVLKVRIWPRVLPLVQPNRIFAAMMIYGTSTKAAGKPKSTTIRKKSTKNSVPIGSYKRQYSTKTNASSGASGVTVSQAKTVFKDQYMDNLFWNLSTQGPAFNVNPDNIQFIQEPNDFYNQLIDGVKRAKKRVTLASLYLGTGKQEIQLVEELKENCKRNPGVKIHILLDGLRGTRLGMVDGVKQSSATMLLDLMKSYPNQVEISMYHTPDLNGILKKVLPPRVNETIGVNHLKTYLFDDDLLLSGANLSKDYFTNRQDRYVWIFNTASVSDHFDKIVGTIGEMCMPLDGIKLSVSPKKGGLDPVSQTKEFKDLAYKKLAKLIRPNVYYDSNGREYSDPLDVECDDQSTWIFPTIQMGPFDIRQDEVVTCHIFESIPRSSKFFITSPYFNLTKTYLDLILSGKPQLDIITCSPEANGFYGAKGVSGAVPDCYSLIEKRFLRKVEESGNSSRISVQEYIRKDWTYHGKGMWITAQNEKLPSITLIGSPNFGSRSVEKDLEAQIVLLTSNPSLQSKMETERKYLWTDTRSVNLNSLSQPDRNVSIWVKVLVYLFGNYL